MIGRLRGIVAAIEDDRCVIDVGGVGYDVNAHPRVLLALVEGAAVTLSIETIVREDLIRLYGFSDDAERKTFRLLQTVQGVGAKAGLAILTVCPPEQLGFAIAAGDKAAIQQADGVGPKLAARIVTELKDKAGKMDLSAKPKNVVAINTNTLQPMGAEQDAVSALINLGYQRSDAYAAVMAVKQANDNVDLDVSEMIKRALRELSL